MIDGERTVTGREDPIFDNIIPLFDEATRIAGTLPELRRKALQRLLAEFPSLKYKTWNGLHSGMRSGKLDDHVLKKFRSELEQIAAVERQGWTCRRDAERLRDLRLSLDKRVQLDPKVDAIPAGPHPKIRDCSQYPLRKSCNFGENAKSKWNRCEFMQYDNSQSISSSARWICTAPRP